MKTVPYKMFFCTRYGQLACTVCPKINSDDFDELEDCCKRCDSGYTLETDVEIFEVKCKKDCDYGKSGEIAQAYVRSDEHFVVNGLICHIGEFMKCFEVV